MAQAPVIERSPRPVHAETGLPADSVKAFDKHLETPVDLEKLAELREFYTEQFDQHKAKVDRLAETEEGRKTLQATGEYPIETKYDDLQGEHIWLSDELVIEGMIAGHLDEATLLHPARIRTLKEKEEEGFKPTKGKDIVALQGFIEDFTAVHSSEFAFEFLSERAARREKLDYDTSARSIIAQGLWSWTTDKMVTLPISTNSTPDTLSAHAIAKVAAMQGMAFIPMDGIWNRVENQVIMFRRALDLLQEDPVLNSHPDKDYLMARARKLIGVTVPANPDKALAIMREIVPLGGELFRIYDARQRSFKQEETVRRARNEFPHVTLVPGNLTDVQDALHLEAAGANGVSDVLGAGGICSTPDVANIAVENIRIAYEMANSDLNIPFIIDSGTGNSYVILMAAGASGFMKGQAIISGLEKPPIFKWQRLENDQWGSNYSGEAAKRTKYLGGKVDYLGRPLFVEGVDEHIVYDPEVPSVATALFNLSQNLATQLLFARGKDIDTIRLNPSPKIKHKSVSAQSAGNTHHQPTNRTALK